MPRWWARLNRATFNRLELRKGRRPVLRHTGRRSGRKYRTPLDAHRCEGGFLFVVVYGTRSDWVKNVLSAGEAVLEFDGEEHRLAQPRVIDAAEVTGLVPARTLKVPRFVGGVDYLLMMEA